MLKNYIKLFFRNLLRQKLFSFINLFGLTISIASTLLIYLYVRHEFSYDKFHNDADRIYRVNQTFIWGEGNDSQFASTGPGVAYAIDKELPEVELITSIHTPGNFIVSYANEQKEVLSFEEDKILAADTNFFSMFNFPMISGNPKTALRQANTLVMTESTAKKYFGNTNAVGKLVRLSGLNGTEQTTYEVTAVIKDTPDNSYIEFDMLLSMNSFPVIKRVYWSWIWTQLETYVRLNKNVTIESTRTHLAAVPKKYAEETLQRVMNTSYDDYVKSGKKWELFLQPMTSIYLPEGQVLNRIGNSGDIKVIYSLIGAAIFISLLSCINFMNLSTAQFTKRIKEASIRKILGLGKVDLAFNFFIEAVIFCFVALVAGLAVTQLILPVFNLLTNTHLSISLFSDWKLVAALVAMVLFMAVISSSYPALFLSAFPPMEAIKGKLKTGKEGKSFRNGLLVFQFVVSIVLIICTGVVFQQLNYVANKDLGFSKENLLVIKHIEGLKDKESFTHAAINTPGAVNGSRSTSLPPTVYGGDKFTAEGLNGVTFPLNFTNGDENFVPTLGIKLKVGKNFSENRESERYKVILNESAVKRIGWKVDESVIGKKVYFPNSETFFEVIGVASDFNYWSLIAPIEPMGIFHINNDLAGSGDRQFVTLKMASQDGEAWQASLNHIAKLWKQHAGDVPFQYEFVDQAFAETFKAQQNFGQLLTVLASLSILIASLGLLGVIVYTLERRSKEIGIRKVSGATVLNILTLILSGYTRLIVLAFVLGAPLAYYIMQQWLDGFAYRAPLSITVYVVAGLATLITAISIVAYHSLRAARLNPVDVLKDE